MRRLRAGQTACAAQRATGYLARAPMTKLRIGLIFGGRSVEHEVSLRSAASIQSALDASRYEVFPIGVDPRGRWFLGAPGTAPERVFDGVEVCLPAVPDDGRLLRVDTGGTAGEAGRIDLVFPIVHGRGGEDGALQGLLELADLPYVGSGVAGSALQMDKEISKRLLRAAGLPVLPWLRLDRHEIEADPDAAQRRALADPGLPLFVKPANQGSSVGIQRVEDPAALLPALRSAARYDDKILCERAVHAREIEVALLGNHTPEASVPGEIRTQRAFYDYTAKYIDRSTELLVPAPLDPATAQQAQRLAIDAYRTLDGRGLGRVDFLLDRADGRLYVNEINSLPGFTDASMYPRLWQASGIAYADLLDRLIELALEHHRERATLETRYLIT